MFRNYLALAKQAASPSQRLGWYRKALRINPDDQTALNGLVNTALERAAELPDDEKKLALLEETLLLKPTPEAPPAAR